MDRRLRGRKGKLSCTLACSSLTGTHTYQSKLVVQPAGLLGLNCFVLFCTTNLVQEYAWWRCVMPSQLAYACRQDRGIGGTSALLNPPLPIPRHLSPSPSRQRKSGSSSASGSKLTGVCAESPQPSCPADWHHPSALMYPKQMSSASRLRCPVQSAECVIVAQIRSCMINKPC